MHAAKSEKERVCADLRIISNLFCLIRLPTSPVIQYSFPTTNRNVKKQSEWGNKICMMFVLLLLYMFICWLLNLLPCKPRTEGYILGIIAIRRRRTTRAQFARVLQSKAVKEKQNPTSLSCIDHRCSI